MAKSKLDDCNLVIDGKLCNTVEDIVSVTGVRAGTVRGILYKYGISQEVVEKLKNSKSKEDFSQKHKFLLGDKMLTTVSQLSKETGVRTSVIYGCVSLYKDDAIVVKEVLERAKMGGVKQYKVGDKILTNKHEVAKELGVPLRVFKEHVDKYGAEVAIEKCKDIAGHKKYNFGKTKFDTLTELSRLFSTTTIRVKKSVEMIGLEATVFELQNKKTVVEVDCGGLYLEYTIWGDFKEYCIIRYNSEDYKSLADLYRKLGCEWTTFNGALECLKNGSNINAVRELDFKFTRGGIEYQGLHGLAEYTKEEYAVVRNVHLFTRNVDIMVKLIKLHKEPIEFNGREIKTLGKLLASPLATVDREALLDYLQEHEVKDAFSYFRTELNLKDSDYYISRKERKNARFTHGEANYTAVLREHNLAVVRLGRHSFSTLTEALEFLPINTAVKFSASKVREKLVKCADLGKTFTEALMETCSIVKVGETKDRDSIIAYRCPECGKEIVVNVDQVDSLRHSEEFCNRYGE